MQIKSTNLWFPKMDELKKREVQLESLGRYFTAFEFVRETGSPFCKKGSYTEDNLYQMLQAVLDAITQKLSPLEIKQFAEQEFTEYSRYRYWNEVPMPPLTGFFFDEFARIRSLTYADAVSEDGKYPCYELRIYDMSDYPLYFKTEGDARLFWAEEEDVGPVALYYVDPDESIATEIDAW